MVAISDQQLVGGMSETIEQARIRIQPYYQKLMATELTANLRNKGLIYVAYEYVVAGFPEEALGLLYSVPQQYFSTVCPIQMREDVEFFQRANAVLRSFRKIGVLPFHLEPIPKGVA